MVNAADACLSIKANQYKKLEYIIKKLNKMEGISATENY